MRRWSLLFLRLSLAGLMLYWGADKLMNTGHGMAVAEKFYGGASVGRTMMQAFGVVQLLLGVVVALGAARRVAYLALLLVTGTTLVGVWASIVDPLGLVVEGGNLVFYPSLIIVAAVLVLLAFRDEDVLSVDARRERGRALQSVAAGR